MNPAVVNGLLDEIAEWERWAKYMKFGGTPSFMIESDWFYINLQTRS